MPFYSNLLELIHLITRIEPTVAPLSSLEDDSYRTSVNIFRQLAVKGRNNQIPVGNCGMSTVNLSQLLSSLGLTVQETTTLTATFTLTKTLSSGYTTFTVAGCTPTSFPVPSCPTTHPSTTFRPSTETVRMLRT